VSNEYDLPPIPGGGISGEEGNVPGYTWGGSDAGQAELEAAKAALVHTPLGGKRIDGRPQAQGFAGIGKQVEAPAPPGQPPTSSPFVESHLMLPQSGTDAVNSAISTLYDTYGGTVPAGAVIMLSYVVTDGNDDLVADPGYQAFPPPEVSPVGRYDRAIQDAYVTGDLGWVDGHAVGYAAYNYTADQIVYVGTVSVANEDGTVTLVPVYSTEPGLGASGATGEPIAGPGLEFPPPATTDPATGESIAVQGSPVYAMGTLAADAPYLYNVIGDLLPSQAGPTYPASEAVLIGWISSSNADGFTAGTYSMLAAGDSGNYSFGNCAIDYANNIIAWTKPSQADAVAPYAGYVSMISVLNPDESITKIYIFVTEPGIGVDVAGDGTATPVHYIDQGFTVHPGNPITGAPATTTTDYSTLTINGPEPWTNNVPDPPDPTNPDNTPTTPTPDNAYTDTFTFSFDDGDKVLPSALWWAVELIVEKIQGGTSGVPGAAHIGVAIPYIPDPTGIADLTWPDFDLADAWVTDTPWLYDNEFIFPTQDDANADPNVMATNWPTDTNIGPLTSNLWGYLGTVNSIAFFSTLPGEAVVLDTSDPANPVLEPDPNYTTNDNQEQVIYQTGLWTPTAITGAGGPWADFTLGALAENGSLPHSTLVVNQGGGLFADLTLDGSTSNTVLISRWDTNDDPGDAVIADIGATPNAFVWTLTDEITASEADTFTFSDWHKVYWIPDDPNTPDGSGTLSASGTSDQWVGMSAIFTASGSNGDSTLGDNLFLTHADPNANLPSNWTYDPSTAMSDPGNGKIRFSIAEDALADNANNLVTIQIAISVHDVDGNDQTANLLGNINYGETDPGHGEGMSGNDGIWAWGPVHGTNDTSGVGVTSTYVYEDHGSWLLFQMADYSLAGSIDHSAGGVEVVAVPGA